MLLHVFLLMASVSAAFAKTFPPQTVDVLIIGAGPSGRQSAMSLGRLGRSALLFDSQEYRNERTLHMHDVIGIDGMAPKDFRALVSEELLDYPSISYVQTKIVDIRSYDQGRLFRATSNDGKTYYGRRVVVATGIIDKLPNIPGMDEVWGTGAFWCLFCDGWEHRNGKLAVLEMGLADDALSAYMLNGGQTTMLTNGQRLTPRYMDKVQADWPDYPHLFDLFRSSHVRFDARNITKVALSDPEDRESAVQVYFGSTFDLYKGMLIKTGKVIRSKDLVDTLGVKYTNDSTAVQTQDRFGLVAPGVYAVGDIAGPSKNVAHALYTGKVASVTLVKDLGREDAQIKAGYL